jgi:hypothetical protein
MVFYIVACHKKDARSPDDIKATAQRALTGSNGRELGKMYEINVRGKLILILYMACLIIAKDLYILFRLTKASSRLVLLISLWSLMRLL